MTPLWSPSPQRVEAAAITPFLRQTGFESYADLWDWSVADLPGFWRAVWEHFEVAADGDPSRVLPVATMPGAVWFPEVALSYPEHVFRGRDPGALALQYADETGALEAWSWDRLREETARVRAGLRALGVGFGDRVVAYLPNVPEAVAAFLATASLGAIWSSCSPDFGAASVIDRFAQIEPKVLLAVESYCYGGVEHDRTAAVAELRSRLTTLERVIVKGHRGSGDEWAAAFPATREALSFERVAFDHPLWVLYSSGTTGPPKAIVQGQGGILLEHLKALHFHLDAGPGDRVLWLTTTGWMMWNYLVSALLTPASIVLYDGSPGHPRRDALWDVVDRAGVTCFGTGAAYLHSCLKAGVRPRAGRELAALRSLGSTGSPLSDEAFAWVYRELDPDTWLFSASGGTDVCTGFLGGCPLLPVVPGELQVRCLGVDVAAYDDEGRPVVEEVGELVVRRPMPSMPVRFWGDPGDERYRRTYFDTFPGVWRHGDWIRITDRGSAVVYGRSDATINRGGIRIGTAEIYRAVLAVEGILDALVIDVPAVEEADSRTILFVVPAAGTCVDDELAATVKARIRSACSPRHAPDEIVGVADVPRTLTGKLVEVPMKKAFMGWDPETVVDRDALANPEAFDLLVQWAGEKALTSDR